MGIRFCLINIERIVYYTQKISKSLLAKGLGVCLRIVNCFGFMGVWMCDGIYCSFRKHTSKYINDSRFETYKKTKRFTIRIFGKRNKYRAFRQMFVGNPGKYRGDSNCELLCTYGYIQKQKTKTIHNSHFRKTR